MAKIQIRRGLKAKLPTLSDGELGLSTDSSELYVGNGGKNVGVVTDTKLETQLQSYRKTSDSYSKKEIDDKFDSAPSGGGGVIVSSSAPSGDPSMLWIDTGNGGIAKYWDGASWVTVKSTWG